MTTTLNFRVNKITSTRTYLPRILSIIPDQSILNDTSARNPSLFVQISVSQTCKVGRNDQERNEFSLILDNGCFELRYQAESLEQKELICDLLERMIRGEVFVEEAKNNEQHSIENNSSHSNIEHEEKSKPFEKEEEEEERNEGFGKFQPQPPIQTKKDRFLRSKHKTLQKVIETDTHHKHSQNEENEIETNSSNNNNNSLDDPYSHNNTDSFSFDQSTSTPQNIIRLKHKLSHSSHIKAEQEASLFLQKLLNATHNQALTMVEGIKQKNKDKDKD